MSIHENLTIVFTDIVGFTQLTSAYTRAQMRHLMRVHDEVLLPIVDTYTGRLVKTLGDSLLLTFRSPTNAVLCGMAIQDALAQRRAEDDSVADLHLRVAISLGEVRRERGDIFGEAVNVASRVESLTPADHVYLSESVFLAMSKAEVPVEDLGVRQLRGIAMPVRLYAAQRFLTDEDQDAPAVQQLPFGGVHLRRPTGLGLRYRMRALMRSAWATRSAQFSRRALTGTIAAVAAGVASVVITVAITALQNGELQPPIPDATAEDQVTPTPVPVALIGLEPALRGESLTGREPMSSPEPRKPGFRPSRDWYARGLELLDSGNEALAAHVNGGLADPVLRPVALRLRGHGQFANHQWLDALDSYAAALEPPNPQVDDERMAANLVAMLSQHTAAVEKILTEHRSDAMLAALAQRSGEPGFYGRHHAVRILEALEQHDAIRWFDYAVEEIRGRSACEDRLVAVNILGELGDPRAIPVLKDARGEGVGGWFQNRCLRGAAAEWIEKLEKDRARPG